MNYIVAKKSTRGAVFECTNSPLSVKIEMSIEAFAKVYNVTAAFKKFSSERSAHTDPNSLYCT